MSAASFEVRLPPLTAGLASEDIAFGKFITITSEDDVHMSDAGERVDGVCYIAALDGQPVAMHDGDMVVLVAGGTITAGDKLVSGADGVAVVSTDNNCYATAMEDAVSGQHFRAHFAPKNIPGSGLETLTTTGAVSRSTKYTNFKPAGTVAFTIGDGYYHGQEKVMKLGGGSATPIAVVTGEFEQNGTTYNTLTLNALGESAKVVWDDPNNDGDGVWVEMGVFGTSPTFSTV